MRLGLKKKLALAHNLGSAQRNHHLQLNLSLTPSLTSKKIILCMLRVGLVIHFYPRTQRLGELSSGKAGFCFTLRYWEGRPVVSIGATPYVSCSYDTLRRRFRHGGGIGFLIWTGGKLLTADECLLKKSGGLVCMSFVS